MPTERQMKRILDWDDVAGLVEELVDVIPHDSFDLLLVVTRGGMVPACLISERTNLRNIVAASVQFHTRSGESLKGPLFFQFPDASLLAGKSVLIVDDVWDSGSTAVHVRTRVEQAGGRANVAVLHYKPRSSRYPDDAPEFFARQTDDWIVYPWDAYG